MHFLHMIGLEFTSKAVKRMDNLPQSPVPVSQVKEERQSSITASWQLGSVQRRKC
jgi:hypothetical protein